jgi:hypothetical protein
VQTVANQSDKIKAALMMETTIDHSRIYQGAARMAAHAKDGTLKLNGKVYTFTFNRREWLYVVTDETGAVLMRYNTKKLATARQWLREYFAN